MIWIDDKPQSVAALAEPLGLRPARSHFVTFIPSDLEDELARLEHDCKGLNENQIVETKFEVMHTADGYHARVAYQQAKQ